MGSGVEEEGGGPFQGCVCKRERENERVKGLIDMFCSLFVFLRSGG